MGKHGIENNANGAAGIYMQDMGSHITATTRGQQTSGRPECDCVCYGAKRQDADNFARVLNQDRIMPGNQAGTDETTSNNHAYAYVGSNKGNWAGSSTHQNGATRTEYLENEAGARANGNVPYQNDQYAAHFHQDGTDNTDPYDQTHKNAALYSGN